MQHSNIFFHNIVFRNIKYMQQSKNNLKPQVVLLLIKIVALGNQSWFHHTIEQDLGISQSEASQTLNRSN